MARDGESRISFFAELRRRRVLRTLALYILGAWGLMQVADVLFPALGLAEESIRYLLFVAVAGFPVALVFGWLYDISSAGIHRTAPATSADLAERVPLRSADYVILACLLAVLGALGYGVVENAENIPLPAGNSPARSDFLREARGDAPPMVGVLPFTHMGSSEEGQFFAEGIHDDLLTRLARISSLRVISRTSVLEYAGTTKKIPEIGAELHADAILEGGVRIAGDRIRINAQLIDARSDEHLWAETFDRQLTAGNIFAVQSDITRAISSALEATLSNDDEAELDLVPTTNLAAYRAFHEIMQWRETVHLDEDNRPRFIAGLEKAIALDPEFTRPMMELVAVLALDVYHDQGRDQLPRIESLIERIGRLAPQSADYYTAQGLYFYYVIRDLDRADALIARARTRAPSDTRLLDIHAYIMRRQGDWAGYVETARLARDLEPQNAHLNAVLSRRLMNVHDYDAARRELQRASGGGLEGDIRRARLALGEHRDPQRYASALEALLPAGDPGRDSMVRYYLTEARLLQRDFKAAFETLALMRDSRSPPEPPADFLPGLLELRILYLLMAPDQAELGEHVEEARQLLGVSGLPPEDYPARIEIDDRALLMLAEGRRELAAELLSGLWHEDAMDRAKWLLNRADFCTLLGLAAAAEEATACLRDALARPSRAVHFIDPLLPYYDPVRKSAPFQELRRELVEQGWLLP